MPNQFIKLDRFPSTADGDEHWEEFSVSWGNPSEYVVLELDQFIEPPIDSAFLSRRPTPRTTKSIELTRRQVNELVRVLRRARDKAYGEDA